jgi:hypothetical protein
MVMTLVSLHEGVCVLPYGHVRAPRGLPLEITAKIHRAERDYFAWEIEPLLAARRPGGIGTMACGTPVIAFARDSVPEAR